MSILDYVVPFFCGSFSILIGFLFCLLLFSRNIFRKDDQS